MSTYKVTRAVQPAGTVEPRIYWTDRKVDEGRDAAKEGLRKLRKVRDANEKREMELEKRAAQSEKKAQVLPGDKENNMELAKGETSPDQSQQLIEAAIDRLLMPPPTRRPIQKRRRVLDRPDQAMRQLKRQFVVASKKLKKSEAPAEQKRWLDHQAMCMHRLDFIQKTLGIE